MQYHLTISCVYDGLMRTFDNDFDNMNELCCRVRYHKANADELVSYKIYDANDGCILEYNCDSSHPFKFYDFINNCY